MSDSDIGKTLPFAQTTTALYPGRLDSVEDWREQLDCGVGRNWLSMTIASRFLPARSSEKRGPVTGDSSACRAAWVASPTGSGSSG